MLPLGLHFMFDLRYDVDDQPAIIIVINTIKGFPPSR